MDVMQKVVLASTVVDLVAVAVLAWIVARSARERDASLVDQRRALGDLKADLAQLLEDAETRAQAIAETLSARERSLRAAADVETGAPGRATSSQKRQPVPAPLVRALTPEDLRAGADPAEARLLRDLEVSVGRARTA
jgi:hypothetical protein